MKDGTINIKHYRAYGILRLSYKAQPSKYVGDIPKIRTDQIRVLSIAYRQFVPFTDTTK